MGQRERSTSLGTDHSMMRELNRSLVLDTIKERGPVSRAGISRATSLAKPTVSAIVDGLLDADLVREVGTGQASAVGGRPPILLEFNARSQSLVGVQIGVRRTNIVVADALARELVRTTVPTPAGDAKKALHTLARHVMGAVAGALAPGTRLVAVGVCVPGLIDLPSGTCLLAPNLGWTDVAVRALLERALAAPVHVVNTADAAVVVESIDGAAKGEKDVALLYAGRGVGASILMDGRLLHGSFGMTGEVGHCHVPGATTQCACGKIGCLETLADGPAIARAAVAAVAARRRTTLREIPPDQLTAQVVADAAAAGDRVATAILADAGRYLGLAVSWLINLFNPAVVLIGGGVAGAGEPLLGPLREAAMEHSLRQAAAGVSIRAWTLGRDAGVTGAVRVALQNSETYYRVMSQG